jgi:hypothetical protein
MKLDKWGARKMQPRQLILVIALTLFVAFPIVAQEATQSTNPAPFVNQPLVPDAVAPGEKGFNLTVNGSGFVSSSVVNWNGGPLTTTFINGSQLIAAVPSADIAKAGTASVTAVNPGPGGGTSNVTFFPVFLPNSFVSLSGSPIAIPAGPWSVATADFNGDGKLDMAVANESLDTVDILLGNGDGTFRNPVEYATGHGPQFVVTGDFDHDGNLDLAICNVFDHTVSILLGNGDGTFKAHKDYATGGTADVVTTGDFSRDGKLDLLVTNFAANTVSVLLGNGDGTFQAPVTYATGTNPNWTAVGDFNGDSKLDLAVSNSTDGTVSILLGNGDGTFKPHTDIAVGQGPACVVAADFNGDAKLDLAIADNIVGGQINVLLGNGDGTFQSPVDYLAGNGAINLIASDLNGDGHLDLVVANTSDSTVSILLGNNDGTFQQQTQLAAGTQPRQVAAGDFNGDGRLDLAVADIGGNSGAVTLVQDETVRLLPPNVDFGVQLDGTKGTAKVAFTNIGKVTVDISGITVSGDRAFGEHSNCPQSLPPKSHCNITGTFKPTRLGPRTALLVVTDDAPGSPQSVPLSGIGVTLGPNATLSKKKLSFTVQLVGTTSPSQEVRLNNWGTEALDITSIVASGDFAETNDCDSTLPSGEHCTIQVAFTPTQRGHRAGALSITDNAPDSPQKVQLNGIGTAVKLEPPSLDFGGVIVGQKSQPQNTTLTNVGKTRLHITDIRVTGNDPQDFLENNDCPQYLGGGKSCTISVTFQPTQTGSRTADVTIKDNGGASPQQVGLSGLGEAKCGGRCVFGRCPFGCRCSFGRCIAATADLMKEFLFAPNQAVSMVCGK